MRELNLAAELLRAGGEGAAARRVVDTADAVRKEGWTGGASARVRELLGGSQGLDAVTLGVAGPLADDPVLRERANREFERRRARIRELLEVPLREAPPPGPRPRSVDL